MTIDATCFKKCKYYKHRERCPNRVKTSWVTEAGQTKEVWDCAPKRTLLLMLNWDQRLMGVQQATEQNRNIMHRLVEGIQVAVDNKQKEKKRIIV